MRSPLAVTTILLCSQLALAMDPPIPPNQYKLKFGLRLLNADSYFDENGEDQSLSSSDDYTDELSYMEFAFGGKNWRNMVLRIDHQDRALTTDNESHGQSGFSRYYLATRQRLDGGRSSFIIQSELGASLSGSTDENEPLSLGSGHTDWQALVSFGQVFFPRRAGFHFDTGIRFREGPPADEFLFNTGIYTYVGKNLHFQLEYDVVESKDDNQHQFDARFYPDDQGHQTLEFEMSLLLTRTWTLSAGYLDTSAGRNIWATDGFQVAMSWQR